MFFYVYYFLFDIKIIEEKDHIYHTGVSNRLILQNLGLLSKSGKEFVIRIPLIPNVTDTEKNITEIAQLLKTNDIKYAELLPYNKMAGGKYAMTGRKYTPTFDEAQEIHLRGGIFEQYGIKTKIL